MASRRQMANLLRSIADGLVEDVLEPATGIDADLLKAFIEGTTTGAVDAGKAKGRKRKVSAYSRAYGRAFKRVAPKYKKKNGSWKKDGFKRAQKEAHKLAGKSKK